MDGDLVAAPCLDVPIDTVVGHVEFAAAEPLGEGRIRPVEYLSERGVPGQSFRLVRPEIKPVGLGGGIQIGGGIRFSGKLSTRRVNRRGVGVRVGHDASVSSGTGDIVTAVESKARGGIAGHRVLRAVVGQRR